MKTSGRLRIAADSPTFFLVLALVLASWLTVFIAGYPRAIKDVGHPFGREFLIQVISSGVGGVAAVILATLRLDVLKRWWKPLALSTVAFALTVPFVGSSQNGAQRWISLGGFNVQPSEWLKLGVIVLFAGWFATRRGVVPAARLRAVGERGWMRALILRLCYLWPILALGVAAWAVEDGNDMGTLMIIIAIVFVISFAAGASRKLWLACLATVVVVGGGMIVSKPYRLERIVHHSSRFEAEKMDDETFQNTRAEIAIASAGVRGAGMGSGYLKQKIPAPATDFAWATIGEETGLLGSLTLIGLLFGVVFRLYWLSRRATEPLVRLVLTGVATWIGFQSAMNITMSNGLFPTVGIPVPFYSAGGSSMVALLMALGLCQGLLAQSEGSRSKEVDPVENTGDRRGYRRTRLSGA